MKSRYKSLLLLKEGRVISCPQSNLHKELKYRTDIMDYTPGVPESIWGDKTARKNYFKKRI